ncbi:MAG: hypothetical protein R3C10_27410 [Pirellulales bacterium]
MIAFTFSGALFALDARRQLVVEEVNAIGTAFLRLDLIDDPTERQLLQKLLKEYVNSRIRLWAKMSHRSAALAEVTVACALQREIWSVAITATERPELESERLLVLPALNETFDLATARTIAVQTHPPTLIYGALFGLASIAAFLVGFSMAKSIRIHRLHVVAFACVTAFMFYMILDIDRPRIGLVRLDTVHSLFSELEQSMVDRIERRD